MYVSEIRAGKNWRWLILWSIKCIWILAEVPDRDISYCAGSGKLWVFSPVKALHHLHMAMGMALVSLLVTLLVAFSCASHARSVPADASDVYEKLETYGFPEGLLPHIVTGYILEPSGKFTLYLESKCPVLIQDKYPLLYEKVITGMLSYGRLQSLKGVTVKAFYYWWSITGIAVADDHSLYFEIGVLSANFPLSNFDDPPICEAHSSIEATFLDSVSSY